MNEEEFLQSYDPKAFDSPIISVDSILFTYHQQQLKTLLVKRANHPFKEAWGLPGGFVDLTEDRTLEETALRKLNEKTGVTPPYIEQLKTYGNADRDPRSWSITVCYSALIAHQDCAPHIDSVDDVNWWPVETLPELAFDHQQLIQDALQRLQQKALYSVIAGYALDKEFTLPELQALHEAILQKPLQKRSFRRRIEQADLIEETGKMKSEGHRPAKLYRLKPKSNAFTFTRNLEN